MHESLFYHIQWVAAHVCPVTASTECGMEGRGGEDRGKARCHGSVWVVMRSLGSVLTLSHSITVCSHLTEEPCGNFNS